MLEKQELCKDYMQGLEPCWKLCDAPFLAFWERESRHFNDESTSTRGPIMDYKDKELVQYYFDQLKKLAQKDHCILIKFDPAIHVNDYDSKSYNTWIIHENIKIRRMFLI